MTACSSEDIKPDGRRSRLTMNTAEVPLDFLYTDSEFCVNEISFECSTFFKNEAQTALFKDLFRTAQQTLSNTVIKTNQLMMNKAKVTVCSDIHTKHTTQSEQHLEFLNFKPGGT